jgi:hypothetical protein
MIAIAVAAPAATVVIVFLNIGISSPLQPIIKCYHSNFTVFSQGMTWASQRTLRQADLGTLVDMAYGVLLYRVLISHAPLDAPAASTLARHLIAAGQAA